MALVPFLPFSKCVEHPRAEPVQDTVCRREWHSPCPRELLVLKGRRYTGTQRTGQCSRATRGALRKTGAFSPCWGRVREGF